MASQMPFPLSSSARSELFSLNNLLHLLFHRNKNQHRQSLWWRSFDHLRRELRKLLAELEIADQNSTEEGNPVGGKGSGKPKKLTFEQKTRERLRKEEGAKRAVERVHVWRDEHVPVWFGAFSQLTASNRFAQLGLVLLAALARVCSILGIIAAYEAQVERERDEAMRSRLQAIGDGSNAAVAQAANLFPTLFGETEDFGEAIARRSEDATIRESGGNGTKAIAQVESSKEQTYGDDGETQDQESEPQKQPQGFEARDERPKMKKHKSSSKKRRNGNAIDDIFGGFG